MWFTKGILRLVLVVAMVTIIPYGIYWAFTGDDYLDILQDINFL